MEERENKRKCPKCRGAMLFVPKERKLYCPSCYRSEDIMSESSEATNAEEQDFARAEKQELFEWGMKTETVRCEDCGVEMIYDSLECAERCPCCGSYRVTKTEAEDFMAPNGVCLFELDAKEAAELFKNRIRKHWFCPKEVKELAKPEAFTGVYLPYWTFDTHTTTTYHAEYGIYHRSKAVTLTDWFWCRGTGREFIDDQKVSGTNRHERDYLLYDILPFRAEKNVAYRPEYLAGFGTERCSVGLTDAWEVAKKFISGRVRRTITQRIQAEQHADEVRELNIQTSYTGITYKYLLVPVWMAHVNYKGKLYRFMVNGQTGSVSGKVPVSVGKAVAAALGVTAALAILLFGVIL